MGHYKKNALWLSQQEKEEKNTEFLKINND